MSVFADLVTRLATCLEPLFAASATAAGIVLFTMLVRGAMHPLARAAVRGEKARARLAPKYAELRRKHAKSPERLQRAIVELHEREKVSPLAGCLPMLVQLPVFFVMYRLFTSAEIGGKANDLLGHELFAAPLGARWADALGEGGVFGAQGVVFIGLFTVIGAVATWTFLRARRAAAVAGPGAGADAAAGFGIGVGAAGPVGAGAGAGPAAGMLRMLPWLSFASLVTAAVVPLAAGLYLATTTTWTAVERAWLLRDTAGRGGAGLGGNSEGRGDSRGPGGGEGGRKR
ncbi:membrane protein insertase YidC [Streptomyces sp. GC420]|uniref:YidC/Oxa1 family membrane protein insertase n=1 Tax=Streptomyces sp. GC420 TaxID=2697568 RepID=UPI001414ED41|nr:membrane protein insertase YidC [Streptomyces sp. GC420]NBM16783.1 membrane protein insertase YidC [Streptomyces sp. GC420]